MATHPFVVIIQVYSEQLPCRVVSRFLKSRNLSPI